MLLAELPPDVSLYEHYCLTTVEPSPEPVSTLVHTQETSGIFTDSVSWRTASGRFDDPTYYRICQAYRDLDMKDGARRESQLLDCHTLAHFARHSETGEVKVISRKCNLRWCPACQKSHQALITYEVSNWLKMFKHPKMLTLTMKHYDIPLREQISELYANFQKLRKRKFFKSKVTGGVWFFQIKKSKTDGLWHPHIHCLITGLFLPRDQLSKLWLKITGDSPVTDIRAVKDPDSAVRHTARYCASPADVTNLSTPEIVEIIAALHGRRIVGTWGLAKSISLKRTPVTDAGSWVNVGGWNEVMSTRGVDDRADQIFTAWNLSLPLEPDVSLHRLDDDERNALALSCRPPPDPYLTNFYN